MSDDADKPRRGRWKWSGSGRLSDEEIAHLCPPKARVLRDGERPCAVGCGRAAVNGSMCLTCAGRIPRIHKPDGRR